MFVSSRQAPKKSSGSWILPALYRPIVAGCLSEAACSCCCCCCRIETNDCDADSTQRVVESTYECLQWIIFSVRLVCRVRCSVLWKLVVSRWVHDESRITLVVACCRWSRGRWLGSVLTPDVHVSDVRQGAHDAAAAFRRPTSINSRQTSSHYSTSSSSAASRDDDVSNGRRQHRKRSWAEVEHGDGSRGPGSGSSWQRGAPVFTRRRRRRWRVFGCWRWLQLTHFLSVCFRSAATHAELCAAGSASSVVKRSDSDDSRLSAEDETSKEEKRPRVGIRIKENRHVDDDLR